MLIRFSSFLEMLNYYALVSPEASALIYEDNGKQYCSYAELLSRSLKTAERYHISGKHCLGVLADGSLDCIINIFAANIAGLQLVILDANTPMSVLKGSLPYADVDCLLTQMLTAFGVMKNSARNSVLSFLPDLQDLMLTAFFFSLPVRLPAPKQLL